MIEGNNNQEHSNLNVIEELDALEDSYELENDDSHFIYYCIFGVICALILVTINQFRLNSKLDQAITQLNNINVEQINQAPILVETKEISDQYNLQETIETKEQKDLVEENNELENAFIPMTANIYSGYKSQRKPELESMQAYTMPVKEQAKIKVPETKAELNNLLSSLKKEDLKRIEYLLSSTENKNFESLKEKDIQRLLSFIDKSKSYNTKKYLPLKVSSIHYPDPSMIDSDPAGYVTSHLGQTQELYGGISASLEQVNQNLLSRAK